MAAGQTIIEKIVSKNVGKSVRAGEIVWLKPIVTARDFAGPNAVLTFDREFPNEPVFNPGDIYFTFDCGHDLEYRSNQGIVKEFAKRKGIKNVFDIDTGIGTHLLIEMGIAVPGEIISGTDSHFGILGAVGALGISVGDTQTAFALKTGLLEYEIPETILIKVVGKYKLPTTTKDLALYVLKKLGAKGALGKAIEFSGETIDALDLSGRITLASLGAEMSAAAVLIAPNKDILDYSRKKSGKRNIKAIIADENARYADKIEINVIDLKPQVARPGDPRDVVEVEEIGDIKINQALIGSCTNGSYEDIKSAAEILMGKRVKEGVNLYIVPSTRETLMRLENEGIIKELLGSNVIIYPAACAGCTSEQVGKVGLHTVAIDTGNRNFAKKQGPGIKYLASPETVAASSITGKIISAEAFIKKKSKKLKRYNGKALSKEDIENISKFLKKENKEKSSEIRIEYKKPVEIKNAMVWVIPLDNIDTDAIYHNSRLQETDINRMGQYTFEEFPAYGKRSEFIKNFRKGDILVVGENFGCGSSREHAVKCFINLGAAAIIGKSFAPIYEGNAESLGFPLVEFSDVGRIDDGDIINLNLKTGEIYDITKKQKFKANGLTENKMLKYQAGGLFDLAKKLIK